MASQVSKGYILSPTREQFADPIGYLSSPEVIGAGQEYGILKVIPPKGWNPPLSVDSTKFSFITRMQKLSELNMRNRSRDFWLSGFKNFMQMHKRKVPEDGMVALVDGTTVHLYEVFNDITKFADDLEDESLLKWVLQYKNVLMSAEGKGREFQQSKRRKRGCEVCRSKERPGRLLMCDGEDCNKMYHLECLTPALSSVPKGSWFCEECLLGGSHEYGFEEDMDSVFTLEKFQKHCQEFEDKYIAERWQNEKVAPSIHQLEDEFWRLVGSQSDLEVRYGADIHSSDPSEISGFPIRKNPSIDAENSKVAPYVDHPFNLCNLPFANGSVFNYIKDEEISGMTVPWIYVGSLFSTFCWHKEDHYTLSANYCHVGSTKKWYGVPAKHCDLFEKVFRSIAPDYFQMQPDLLHQLVTLISPDEIIKTSREKFGEEIEITTLNQQANEFIVTFPKVYHCGFNCGYNFNEAVNFITSDWLKYGHDALQEYKAVGKENVFNHWKLLERILDDVLHRPREELDEMLTTDKTYRTLVELSARNFLSEYERVNSCVGDDAMEKVMDVLSNSKVDNLVKVKHHGHKRVTRRRMASDPNDEELLCHECKTALGFIWYEINEKPEPHNQQKQLLPTPKTTPVLNQHKFETDMETEFQKIVEEAKRDTGRKRRRVSRKENTPPAPPPKPLRKHVLLCVDDFRKLEVQDDVDEERLDTLRRNTTVHYDRFVLAINDLMSVLQSFSII